jgi:hypothetical protein
MSRMTRTTDLLLTCYADTHGYGWPHVDLFAYHPDTGRELDWVHWQTAGDGPDAADAATAAVEPDLHRTSDWRHGISADGSEYWTASAAWG